MQETNYRKLIQNLEDYAGLRGGVVGIQQSYDDMRLLLKSGEIEHDFNFVDIETWKPKTIREKFNECRECSIKAGFEVININRNTFDIRIGFNGTTKIYQVKMESRSVNIARIKTDQ